MLTDSEKADLKTAWLRAKKKNDGPTMQLIRIICRLEAEARKLKLGWNWVQVVEKELGIN